jgi:hypothetical protein
VNKKSIFNNLSRMLIAFSLLFIALSAPLPAHAANRTDIVGPAGSGRFGENVTVLANGNFVVTDSQYSPGGAPAQIGAAYLYDGETFFLISTLTGSQAYITAEQLAGILFGAGPIPYVNLVFA